MAVAREGAETGHPARLPVANPQPPPPAPGDGGSEPLGEREQRSVPAQTSRESPELHFQAHVSESWHGGGGAGVRRDTLSLTHSKNGQLRLPT